MWKHKNREFTFAPQQQDTDQKSPSRSTNWCKQIHRAAKSDHDQIEHESGELIAHESGERITKVSHIWDRE
jgi:hypothetical protein